MVNTTNGITNLNCRKLILERVNTLRLHSFIRESDALAEVYPEEIVSLENYGHYQALKHSIAKGYNQELLSVEDFLHWCRIISEKEVVRNARTNEKISAFLESFNESLLTIDPLAKDFIKVPFITDSLLNFLSIEPFSLGNDRILRLLCCYLATYLNIAIIIFYEREKSKIEEAFSSREALLRLIAKKITEIYIQDDGKVMVKVSETLPQVGYRGLDGSKLFIDFQELVSSVGAWS
jgi:hypothetical protein